MSGADRCSFGSIANPGLEKMKPLNNRFVRTLWGGLISLPFPGLGHILARRWTFGAGLLGLMLVGGVALGYTMDGLAPTPGAVKVAIALMGFGFLVAGLAALDAMRILWRTEQPPAPGWPRSTWFAGLVAFLVTGATSLAYDQDWKSYSTPSTSMAPTLEIGDYFFADLRPFAPRRGDVVVFRKPGDHNTVYIKRIVGLPGETVQMVHGRLTIDGATVPRETKDFADWANALGKTKKVPVYMETLPGTAPHATLETDGDDAMLDNTAAFTVPAGHFFVLGDNRDNSSDSRLPADRGGIGFVPAGAVFGKAGAIYWSRTMDRVFRAVM